MKKYFSLFILYFALSFLLFSLSCSINKTIKKSETSLFSRDFIQADQGFYTKAILEYHIANTVVRRLGKREDLCCDGDTWIIIDGRDCDENRIDRCTYKEPKKLADLNSGFQYRYYLFNTESKAALQAFGITDIEYSGQTQYLIIDYIQYKDIMCEGMPSVRYAVGLRSELQIKKIDAKSNFDGVGALANLAAQVQIGKAEVNFSLKTIGITGAPSRLNIPQGVSFNVTTYKDFQNSIEFIKNTLHDTTPDLEINPEIIPIMDQYRPNTQLATRNILREIAKNSREVKRIKRKLFGQEEYRDRLIKVLDNEINYKIKEHELVHKIDEAMYSLNKYSLLVDCLEEDINKSKKFKELVFNNYEYDLYNLEYDFDWETDYDLIDRSDFNYLYEEFPSISKLDKLNLNELGEFYFYSDLTREEFDTFLNHWSDLNPSDEGLQSIVNRLNYQSLNADIEDLMSFLIKPEYNAGLVPYTIKSGEVHIMLGMDFFYDGFWMDFIGQEGIEDNGDSLITAVREFYEETNCFYSPDDILNIWNNSDKKYRAEFKSPDSLPCYRFFIKLEDSELTNLSKNRRCKFFEKTEWQWINASEFLTLLDSDERVYLDDDDTKELHKWMKDHFNRDTPSGKELLKIIKDNE